MEKKLRTKFTFLSVCAFFIALMLISSALIYANYNKIVKQADSTLERIINSGGKFGMPKDNDDDDKDDERKHSPDDKDDDEKPDAEEDRKSVV